MIWFDLHGIWSQRPEAAHNTQGKQADWTMGQDTAGEPAIAPGRGVMYNKYPWC